MSEIGKNFEQGAIEQLGGVMKDAESHIIATTTGIVAGESVVYGGPPGGSKTNLMRGVPQLIEGITPDMVAELSPLADTTPKENVGSVVEVEGEKIYIPGAIRRETRVLLDDDGSRKNPYTQDSLLGVREGGYVLIAGDKFDVDLLVDIQTLNASKPGQPIFKLSEAGASRSGAGTIFGKTSTDTMKDIFGRNFVPSEVGSVTSIAEIEALKAEAKKLKFSDSTDIAGAEMVEKIREAHEEILGYSEAGGRMARQLGNLVAARLVLSNEKGSDAGEKDALHLAAGMIIDARVSGLSPRPEEHALEIRQRAGVKQVR